MTADSPFDGASLLPHGGHARFVREVVTSGDDALVCSGRIPAENPFARDGVVPGYVLVEFAAQAAAIEVLASMAGEGARPRTGYLARAHELSWTPAGVPAGAPLTASVRRVGSVPPLYVFRATVTLDGAEVLGGEFSLFIEEERESPHR